MGVGGDAEHPGDAALPQREQEGPPRGVVLGVHGLQAQEGPVARVGRSDGGGHRAAGHVAAVAALDVGRVYPEIREPHAPEGALPQVGDGRVQRLADAGHLAGAHAVGSERAGDPLDLARGDAARHHLGHRRHDRPVDPAVAVDEVVREERPAPELGYPERDRPHAREQAALAVAVALVALGAGVVGLGVHHLVDERLRERAHELVQVDHAVVESGNLGHRPLQSW